MGGGASLQHICLSASRRLSIPRASNPIRAGKELQTKAEEEAAEKYQAGLALLQEMEAKDNMRTAAVYR